MTFFEAMQALKEGKKVRNTNWINGLYLLKEENKICFSNPYIAKYLNDTDLNYGSWELYKEPILNEEEKEYLSNVIKPFKNRVCYIIKGDVLLLSYKEEYIQICVNSHNHYINLPTFVKGSMYKNMKSWYKYTVEELDL